MTHHNAAWPRWTFCLIDGNPGPSTGDAEDHIVRLGFDPWSFGRIELVDEVTAGRWIVATFSVTGPVADLARLRVAHQEFLRTSPAGSELPNL